jgi:uncharacterized protein YggU (UPF0235/DUF167 family)
MARTLVNVTVKPGSRAPGIDRTGKSIVVRVREHAIEGAANEACIHALAAAYGVSRSSIELVGGFRSKRKRFAIHLP